MRVSPVMLVAMCLVGVGWVDMAPPGPCGWVSLSLVAGASSIALGALRGARPR